MRTQLLILYSFISFNLVGQNIDLPENPKPGKCYIKCFDYDKLLPYQEVDCDILKVQRKPMEEKSMEELIKERRAQIKFIKYQEKLVNLGYDLQLTGKLAEKTWIAHTKYLTSKEIKIRREQKELRKLARKEKRIKRRADKKGSALLEQ